MNKELKKQASELMEYNKVDKLYKTSDNKFFLTENAANNHALRDYGKKREKALDVKKVTAGDVGLKIESGEPNLEKLMAEFEKKTEAKEVAEKTLAEKEKAKVAAEDDAKAAKGTDKETATAEAAKKANTAFKSALTRANNLDDELAELEEQIEKFEE